MINNKSLRNIKSFSQQDVVIKKEKQVLTQLFTAHKDGRYAKTKSEAKTCDCPLVVGCSTGQTNNF